jgi:hypothetical protein
MFCLNKIAAKRQTNVKGYYLDQQINKIYINNKFYIVNVYNIIYMLFIFCINYIPYKIRSTYIKILRLLPRKATVLSFVLIKYESSAKHLKSS